jgi:sugar O-acyltransferase (sialic acid O-acetyltransferase NeuD family)
MKKKIVLFGMGGLFGDLVDIIHLNGATLEKIVLNLPDSLREDKLSRLPYSVKIEPLISFEPQEDEGYAMGFKGTQIIPLRELLKESFSLSFENLIHPSAILSPSVILGEGCVINAGTVIGSHAKLGNHIFVNRGASVGHDTSIGDYVFIGPNATVCGEVHLEEGVSVFAHATVIERKRIGAHAQIAAGAVCLRDVPLRALMAGVPAQEKKRLA